MISTAASPVSGMYYTNQFSPTKFELSTHRLAFFLSAPPLDQKMKKHSSGKKSKSGEKKKKRKRPPPGIRPDKPTKSIGMYMNPFSPTMFKLSANRKMFLPYYRFISRVISSSSTSDFPAILSNVAAANTFPGVCCIIVR
jgi:hypothetical protein